MIKDGWIVETYEKMGDTLECDWCGYMFPIDTAEEWDYCPMCGDYKPEHKTPLTGRFLSKISVAKRRRFLDFIGVEVGEPYTEPELSENYNLGPKYWFHELLTDLVLTIYGDEEDDEQ